MPSQSYTLLDIPGDGAKLVHVHPGAEELNRVYRAGLGIARHAGGLRGSRRGAAAAQ